jgi:hypothetical protein
MRRVLGRFGFLTLAALPLVLFSPFSAGTADPPAPPRESLAISAVPTEEAVAPDPLLSQVDLTDPGAIALLEELFPRRDPEMPAEQPDGESDQTPALQSVRRSPATDPSVPRTVKAYRILDRPVSIVAYSRPDAGESRPPPVAPTATVAAGPARPAAPPTATAVTKTAPPKPATFSAPTPPSLGANAPKPGSFAAPGAIRQSPPPPPTAVPAKPAPPIAPATARASAPPAKPAGPVAATGAPASTFVPPARSSLASEWEDTLTELTVIEQISSANITFYDCAYQGFCGGMYNGTQVFEGAAACSWDLPLATRFVIVGDPTQRLYVCEDRGLLADTWIDIFFYDPADGWAWQAAVGRYVTILIVN